eukprot:RCo034674
MPRGRLAFTPLRMCCATLLCRRFLCGCGCVCVCTCPCVEVILLSSFPTCLHFSPSWFCISFAFAPPPPFLHLLQGLSVALRETKLHVELARVFSLVHFSFNVVF